jgi:hypothetical protein
MNSLAPGPPLTIDEMLGSGRMRQETVVPNLRVLVNQVGLHAHETKSEE